MTVSPSAEIPSAYNAADVEGRIYENWLAKGYFTAHVDRDKTPFTIIMPPPNVTGELHLGHALTAALEDALCRWHRMLGHSTLWLPGKDHAGIATQWVVEQLLAREGTSRHELGRERFVERVWEWVEKYGNTIDERTHHRGRDSPDAANMERDGCVGPGLHLQMHVQSDSRPAHRHIHNRARVPFTRHDDGAGLVDGAPHVAAFVV